MGTRTRGGSREYIMVLGERGGLGGRIRNKQGAKEDRRGIRSALLHVGGPPGISPSAPKKLRTLLERTLSPQCLRLIPSSSLIIFLEMEKNPDIFSLLWSLKLMNRFGMASLEDKSEHTAGPKCGKRCCHDWFLNKAKKN